MLGHIPLAITQACAYLDHSAKDDLTPMTIAKYETLFHETQGNQLYLLKTHISDQFRDPELSNSVVTTWQISFEQIKRENPLAGDMLSLVGVLDPQCIPKSLLSLDDNSAKTMEALSRLLAFCLIKAEMGHESFEMHHLVQLSLRAWLDDRSETTKWTCKALEILSNAFPEDAFFTSTNWSQCSKYLPHTHAVLSTNVLTIANISIADNQKFPDGMKAKAVCLTARLLNVVGNYYDTRGLFTDSICQHRRAYEIWTSFVGSENTEALGYYSNVAETLSQQGKWAEAEAIDREVLHKLSKTPPDAQDDRWNNISVLVQGNLARALHHQGKYGEARSIDEHVLRAKMEKPGIENRDIWISMNALAESLATDGELERAEALSRDVVAKQTAGLGPGNMFTLESRRTLAVILESRKRFEEAEREIRDVIELEGDVFREGHPQRMASAKLLASILCTRRRFADAETVLRNAQRLGEAFSSEQTLLMANLKAELAAILLAQGEHDEAIELCKASLAIRDNLLPTRDLTTYNLTAILGSALAKAGKITSEQDIRWETLQGLIELSEIGMMSVMGALFDLARSFSIDMDPDPEKVPDGCTRILEAQPCQISGNWEFFKPRVTALSVILLRLGMRTEGLELGVRFRKRPDLSTIQPIMALMDIYKASGRLRDAVPLVEELIAHLMKPSNSFDLSPAFLRSMGTRNGGRLALSTWYKFWLYEESGRKRKKF
ncbi:hypothetical protein LTR28_005416 [Elasticomyces elasticus]|nr:hypothetical protein LTR28_005416 [Elasticomyces elasticus]